MSEKDSLLGVGIGAVAALGVVAALDGFGNAFAGADGPAWVQAVGSVAAIVAAVIIAKSETRQRAAEQRRGREERLRIKAEILEKIGEISASATDRHLQICQMKAGLWDMANEPEQVYRVVEGDLARVRPLCDAVHAWSLNEVGSVEELRLVYESHRLSTQLIAWYTEAIRSRELWVLQAVNMREQFQTAAAAMRMAV